MQDSWDQARQPAVSIILPTYNRARFLPQAFESIRGQRFTDWELVVVDDGSTDATRVMVASLSDGLRQPVHYVNQENQGAYGARNTGLDLARGEYIAFYDSDDFWLPHHLQECVAALEANPEVDWVYAASRIVDFATGQVLAPSSFYRGDHPQPFLHLRVRPAGRLRVIEDPAAIECSILDTLYAGLQCSVIRRDIFTHYRFEATRRNGADQLIVVHALAAGRRLAYLDDVQLVYHVHEQNSSAVGQRASLEKHLRVLNSLVEGFEELRVQLHLTPAQIRALDRRLSREYFWHLGYVLLEYPGRETEALALLRRGLRLWPTNLAYWKTYVLAWLRVSAGLKRPPSETISTGFAGAGGITREK